jgi:hypothetical protein
VIRVIRHANNILKPERLGTYYTMRGHVRMNPQNVRVPSLRLFSLLNAYLTVNFHIVAKAVNFAVHLPFPIGGVKMAAARYHLHQSRAYCDSIFVC